MGESKEVMIERIQNQAGWIRHYRERAEKAEAMTEHLRYERDEARRVLKMVQEDKDKYKNAFLEEKEYAKLLTQKLAIYRQEGEPKVSKSDLMGYWNLGRVIGIFESADRCGSEKDEPEGSRYIIISETLVQQITHYLTEVELSIKEIVDE